jgi:hypothetical protein
MGLLNGFDRDYPDGDAGFYPRVSAPLENSQRHRVYAGISVLKEELFSKLKLTQRMKLIKMPRSSSHRETPPEYKDK